MITLLTPISVLTIFNAQDILQIVFGRGAFNSKAVSIASQALIGYAFMFTAVAIGGLFGRLHYSNGNSKTPAINNIVGIIFNIILSIILARRFGVLGVTFATSVATFVSAVLNVISARIYCLTFRIREFLIHVPLWILGCIVCVILSFLGRVWWSENSPLLRFVFTVLLSGFGYLICSLPILWPYLKRYIVDIVRKIFRS